MIATRCADGSSAQEVVCWTFEGADRHPGFPCNVVGHAGVYSKGHPVRGLSPMFGVGTGGWQNPDPRELDNGELMQKFQEGHMSKMWLTRLALAVGGPALVLAAGAGTASATPDIGPMVNTTCTFDQAMRAVHAENPFAASYLDASPPNLQFLRQFMSSTPDQRVSMLNAVKNNPGADEALPVFTQMMTSCVNY